MNQENLIDLLDSPLYDSNLIISKLDKGIQTINNSESIITMDQLELHDLLETDSINYFKLCYTDLVVQMSDKEILDLAKFFTENL